MTNREKYEKQILDIICNKGGCIAVVNGEPVGCHETKCFNCQFDKEGEGCKEGRIKWANSEYVEPTVDWNKVTVDTPILVRDSVTGKWYPRYFAECAKHGVYAWDTGATSWSSGGRKIYWKYAKLAESEGTDA